jgi:hypothetical protein
MMPSREQPLRFGWRVLCICFAALKPTLTFPLLAYWLLTDTLAILTAGGLSLLIAAAVAAATSGLALPYEWLASLESYAGEAQNLPDRLVSLHNLLLTFWQGAPVKLLPAIAFVGGLLVGIAARRRSDTTQYLILLGLVISLMPLHLYDLAIVAVLAGCAPALRWPTLSWYGPALALLMRPSAIERVLELFFSNLQPDRHVLASLGGLIMLIGLLASYLFRGDLFERSFAPET